MSTIKVVGRFQGNILERNKQRIEMIRFVKQDICLSVIIKKFLDNVRNYNLKNVRYIIENELFFERISVDMICRYMDTLNKYENIEYRFEEAYILKAENGFRKTIDYLVRQTY
ncbi:TPA: hypothetical protein ACVT6Z_001394 [Clostridioides difficile]|nr:hypothetical protein [Clostridioides difficile]HBF3756582.1 hypothetical protein [Clostridioides difficile]HBF6246919.1 hypothetical protein [Clostridioides difficile]HBF7929136.1 hypothetical protein [Clostridioides difficile]HBY3218672.1 hypothetical protein [Clostridioides difficile]